MKKGRTIYIAAKRAFCLMLALVLFVGLVSCKKKFDDPNEHFKYAIEHSIDNSFDSVDVKSGNVKLDDGESVKLSVQPQLSDAFLASLGSGLPFELGFVNDAVLSLTAGANDDLVDVVLDLALGGDSLLTIEGILDMDANAAYVDVSDGFDKALYIDLKEIAKELGSAVVNEVKSGELTVKVESIVRMQSVIDDYVDLVLSYVDGVTSEQGTLTVGDISEESTLLTWNVSEKKCCEIVISVMEKIRDDEALKEFIISCYEGDNAEAEEFYNSIISSINENLPEIKEELAAASDNTALTVAIHVNGENDIIACDAKVIIEEEYGTGESSISIARATKDGAYAFELAVIPEDDAAPLKLIANGTEEKGIASGSVSAYFDGKQVVSLKYSDWNVAELEKGYAKGSVVIKSGSGLSNLLDMDPSAVVMLGMFDIRLDLDCGEKASEMLLSLQMNGSNFAGVKVNTSIGELGEVSVPTEYESDAEKWLGSLDIAEIFDALENSALPKEVVYALKSLIME
ncbi:MAG: hypothetical protein IJN63_08615 [Clostridia bacterium]|nr:hypothetical protein [Clostridia bacterium]